jgi:hypothetical protein
MIPVITGTAGTIAKLFREYLNKIPGKHDFKKLQKTAVLDTARILGKVQM